MGENDSEPGTSPFTPPATCIISEDEIAGLLELLKNVTLPINGEEDIPPPFIGNDNSTAGTGSKFHEIRHVVLELRRKFQNLLKDQVSQATYFELKQSYEEEVKKLKREIDEVMKNAKKSQRLVVGRLKHEFQEMQAQSDKAFSKFEQEREAHRETQTLLCIAEIKNNEVDSAVEKFTTLGDNQLLGRIVVDVYASNAENTEKMLQFVQKLPNLEQHVVAHSAIYEEMNRNNHLKSQYVLLLSNNVDEVAGRHNYIQLSMSLQTQYHKLKDTLSPLVHEIINSFSGNVRNGNYEEVKSFANRFETAFERYISRLVELTYANNIANTEGILRFVKELLFAKHGVVAIDALFKEMELNYHLKSPELIHFECRAKEMLGLPGYKQLPQDYLSKLTRLNNALTTLVEDIIKSWSVSVINGVYEEIKTIASQFVIGFEPYMSNIVKLAYSNNNENTEKILNYLIELPSINHRVIGIAALFQEMRRNDHLWTQPVFYLAYRIKEALLDSNISTEKKTELESVKAGLPETVVNIMWNVVCIKHVSCNEYFFATDDSEINSLNIDEERRYVFVYKSAGTRVKSKGDWKFEPIRNGKSFLIMSSCFKEYLYSIEDLVPLIGYRRRLGTWKQTERGTNDKMEWDIELCEDRKSVRIKSVWAKEYLFAQNSFLSYSYWFRKVATWQPGDYDSEMLWQICKS